MKKRILFAVLCFAALLAGAVQSSAADSEINADTVIGNLISNGTFENGISGWTASGEAELLSYSDGAYRSSANSMRIDGAGEALARMSSMYQQETYEMNIQAKAVSDDVTVSLKYDYAGKGETLIVSKMVSAGKWTDITGYFKWQSASSYSYKGAEIKNVGGSVIIEVSGACLIDEVVVKAAEEKIIPPKSNDDLGGWFFRKIGDIAGSLEYDSTENALYGKSLQTINAAMLYTLAMEKGAEYRLTAKIKRDAESSSSAYVYFGSNAEKTKIDNLSESEWTDINLTYTCPYPADTTDMAYDDGTHAGTMLAFGGLGSKQLANLKVKDVSVKKADNNAALPEIRLTAAEEAETDTEVTPSAELINAAGARYKYIFNDETVCSGYITDSENLPAYPANEEGTLEISVTPFNEYGYGETQLVYTEVYSKEEPEKTINFYINGSMAEFDGGSEKKEDKAFAELDTLAELIGANFEKTSDGCVIEKGIHRLSLKKNKIFADYNGRMAIVESPFTKRGKMYADACNVCEFMGVNAEFDGSSSVYITVNENGYLINTIRAVREKGTVNVGFAGGAAAYGKGAGDNGSSYRSLLMERLKNYYGGVDFRELNNTIGITGIDLELFRIDNLLLQNPDVIFIDFCDEDCGLSYDELVKYLEWLVLEIKGCSADTDIVFLGTWSESLEESCLSGEKSDMTRAYEYISQKYGTAFLNIGEELHNYAADNEKSASDYMRWRYYPNDEGHAFYAEKIFNFFKEAAAISAEPSIYIQASPELPQTAVRGYTVSADAASETGFESVTERIGSKSYKAILGEPGDELNFKFTGNAVGVLWICGIDTGSAEYSIDGGEMKTVLAFDGLGTRERRLSYKILADDLSDGEHNLKIRVGSSRAAMSLGNRILINGFLVGANSEVSTAETGFEAVIDDIAAEEVSDTGNVRTHFTLKNNTAKPTEIAAIAACYNSNGELSAIDIRTALVQSGASEELAPEIYGIGSGNMEIKQMLWRHDCGAYIPVCPAKTITVCTDNGKE